MGPLRRAVRAFTEAAVVLAVLGVGAGGGLLDGHAAVGAEVNFVSGCLVGGFADSRVASLVWGG